MDSLTENPFLNMEDDNVRFPRFKRKTQYFKISEEARKTLDMLATRLLNPNATLSDLMEAIGLGVFTIQEQQLLTDPDSNISTEDCRTSGYMDGYAGNHNIFLTLFGNMSTPFEIAYMRGYYEGSFMRLA